MASARTTRAYPAIFGSHGSATLVALGSRCGLKNHPSIRITATQTAAAHIRAMKRLSPSFTKCPQNNFSTGLLADLQNGQKSLLRDFHLADLLHALFAGLLLLEQLALARDVAAVALGQHVLAHRLDAGARDDMAADRRLHRDVEHLARNQFLHLIDQLPAAVVGIVAMYDER